jgi:hypothetical protein
MMQNVSVVLPDQVGDPAQGAAAQTGGKMRLGGHSGHK